MYRRLWKHRDLVLSLVRRQFQLKYRQSAVGIVWAILPPLATLGASLLVFHKVAKIGSGTQPYAIFTLAAIMPWTFFTAGLTQGIPAIVNAQPMVSRLAFPRAALPLGAIGTSFLDLAISAGIFIVFALAFGNGIPLTALWFPVLLIIEIMFMTGLVLLGAGLNVFARDVRLAVPLLTQLWLFVTPVMYPLTSVPRSLRGFYLANPMTGVVESFRRTLVNGHAPEVDLIVPAIIGAVVAFFIGSWYFGSTEPRFADVI